MSLRTTATALLAAAVLVLGWNAVQARADGEDVSPRIQAINTQLDLLRAENAYLLAREAALTKYVVSMNTAASALAKGVSTARAQGFEAAAISAQSRIAVLSALELLSKDLATGVPAPTKADELLKAEVEIARRAVVR